MTAKTDKAPKPDPEQDAADADAKKAEEAEALASLGVAAPEGHPLSGPRAAETNVVGVPGDSGFSLTTGGPNGKKVSDIMKLGDDDGAMSTVVIKEPVYETHDLPGTNRKGTRLLYAKGQRVPVSELRGLHVQAAQHKEQSGSAETK